MDHGQQTFSGDVPEGLTLQQHKNLMRSQSWLRKYGNGGELDVGLQPTTTNNVEILKKMLIDNDLIQHYTEALSLLFTPDVIDQAIREFVPVPTPPTFQKDWQTRQPGGQSGGNIYSHSLRNTRKRNTKKYIRRKSTRRKSTRRKSTRRKSFKRKSKRLSRKRI